MMEPREVSCSSHCFLARPMPCSPESVPLSSRPRLKRSSTASSTRAHSCLSRLSQRMPGWRLPSPAWPKVAMVTLRSLAIFSRPAIMAGILERGTVTSSIMKVGLARARAGMATRRASQMFFFCSASLATTTSVEPHSLSTFSTTAASSSTWAGWPSTSTSSMAPASRGRPIFT